MGEALVGDPAAHVAGPKLPRLERRARGAYEAETAVHGREPNPVETAKREFGRFYREAKRAGVELTVCARAYDSVQERVALTAREATAYLSAQTVEARRAVLCTCIRQRRKSVALEAAKRLREGIAIEKLTPAEEAALREFDLLVTVEGDGGSRETLREDFYRQGSSLDGPYLDQEWLPYGEGPLGYQLYLADMWEQLAKAWWAWHHDPFAKRGINLITAYILGRGAQVRCKDENAQVIADEFWSRENMPLRLRRWTTDLSRDGELFVRDTPTAEDPSKTRVRSLDPTTIWEIVTDAEDIEFVYMFVQRYMTRTQLFPPPNGADAQKWIERDLYPDEVTHVKVNAGSAEVRGRSDAFVILSHLKRLRDWLDCEVIKAQAQAAWHRDITVKGNEEEVEGFIAQQEQSGKPEPGEDWFHNDAVTISLIQSANRAPMGNGSTYAGFVNAIALGFGLSKEDFGVAENASLASAEETAEPSEVFLDERQLVIGELVARIMGRVLTRAQRAGKLAPNADLTVEVILPDIRREDFVKRLNALALAEAMSWISNETAATHAVGEINLRDYDLDTERQRIADERKLKLAIAKQYEQVPRGIPSTSDAAFAPGDVPNPDAAGGAPPNEARESRNGRAHAIEIIP